MLINNFTFRMPMQSDDDRQKAGDGTAGDGRKCPKVDVCLTGPIDEAHGQCTWNDRQHPNERLVGIHLPSGMQTQVGKRSATHQYRNPKRPFPQRSAATMICQKTGCQCRDRDHQGSNQKDAARSRWQLPSLEGIKACQMNRDRNREEEQGREHRNDAIELRSKTQDQADCASNNQQPTDQLTPLDVLLVQELLEHIPNVRRVATATRSRIGAGSCS